jgi:hypothetical protein
MDYHCDSVVNTVEQLYRFYKEKSIVKLRMQRKIRWVDFDKSSKKANNYDFIKFMLKTKNTVNPLLLLERIVNNRKCMFVIDGNNRINAIISFLSKPLYYLDDYIPKHLPENIAGKLKETSLVQLINEYTTFKKFCQSNGFWPYYVKNINLMMEDDNVDEYEIMVGKLQALHVLDTKVPVTKFENMNIDDIKEIYEGVNKNGVKLTKQEILASTTSLHYYNSYQISKFIDIQSEVKSYYSDTKGKECLKFESDTYDELNLFEVLIAVQTMLSRKHSFVPPVGSLDLDVIFKCYEVLSNRKFEDYNPYLSNFIDKFEKACDFITELQNTIFNKHIAYKSMEKKLSLKCNNLTVFICWLFRNFDSLNDGSVKNKALSILVYHELCSLVKDKETKAKFTSVDVLASPAGGTYVNNLCHNIIKKDIDDKYLPTQERMRELLYALQKENIDKCVCDKKPNRSKANKYVMLILSIYFSQCVPLNLIKVNKNLDHIIPYSVHWDEQLDINRLGNLVLIDDNINQKKSNNMIDETFINEHKLFYYNYPGDYDVKTIMSSDKRKIKNNVKYNEVCNRREVLYFDTIISSICESVKQTNHKD